MKTQKITQFQRDTLATLKALDYDAFARHNGTIEVTVQTNAPRGGTCETTEVIVAPADLTKFLDRYNGEPSSPPSVPPPRLT